MHFALALAHITWKVVAQFDDVVFFKNSLKLIKNKFTHSKIHTEPLFDHLTMDCKRRTGSRIQFRRQWIMNDSIWFAFVYSVSSSLWLWSAQCSDGIECFLVANFTKINTRKWFGFFLELNEHNQLVASKFSCISQRWALHL